MRREPRQLAPIDEQHQSLWNPIDCLLSLGVVTRKKQPLREAAEDVGRVLIDNPACDRPPYCPVAVVAAAVHPPAGARPLAVANGGGTQPDDRDSPPRPMPRA
jgi:hypothetical protein